MTDEQEEPEQVVFPDRSERMKKLRAIFATAGWVSEDAHAALEILVTSLCDEVESLKSEIEDAEGERDDSDCEACGRTEEAFSDLIDSLDRPVGTLTFNIANKPAFDRAMTAMCDAVNGRFASLP